MWISGGKSFQLIVLYCEFNLNMSASEKAIKGLMIDMAVADESC